MLINKHQIASQIDDATMAKLTKLRLALSTNNNIPSVSETLRHLINNAIKPKTSIKPAKTTKSNKVTKRK